MFKLPSNLDALIISNPYNILYLTGFKGISDTEREATLIATKTKNYLIAPRLYQTETLALKSKNLEVLIVSERDKLLQAISKITKNAKTVGFEQNNLSFGEHQTIKKQLKGKKLVPTQNLVEKQRIVKTEEEIKKIEKAQIISQQALELLLKSIKPGQTEQEIAQRLALIIQKLGGDGLAFETIVASGPNSGLPHYLTGKRTIKKGDILLFDFGAKYKNYCADLSRTVFIGKPNDEFLNIYRLVQNAQKLAISKIESKLKTHESFHHANKLFVKNKVDDKFLHSLGHGIGLQVHEPPYLRKTESNQTLEEGMVFSIEPGLYFPWGGVRIEDLVAIENGNAKVLGKISQEIIIV